MRPLDYIFLLGGGIIQSRSGEWRTCRFGEGDTYGETFDFLRVKAAYELYKKNNKLKIIILGGKGQYQHHTESNAVSAIIKKELSKLGVPAANLLCESRSSNTVSQLVAVAKYTLKLNLKSAYILSNNWHLPRVKCFIKYTPVLQKFQRDTVIKYVSAEKILVQLNNEKWSPVLRKALKSQAFKERVKKEKKGIRDIINGTYKF